MIVSEQHYPHSAAIAPDYWVKKRTHSRSRKLRPSNGSALRKSHSTEKTQDCWIEQCTHMISRIQEEEALDGILLVEISINLMINKTSVQPIISKYFYEVKKSMGHLFAKASSE